MSRRAPTAASCADLSTLCEAPPTQLAACLGPVLAGLPAEALPAGLCCDRGGVIEADGWSFDVLDVRREVGRVEARLGFFFREVVGGCNCHDDPTVHTEFRTLGVTIDCETRTLAWRLE